MKKITLSIIISIIVAGSGLVSAQTPTPLPGTPQALTCVPFTSSPGMTGIEIINNWEYLDRACVLLENTTGDAIAISHCQAYFGQTQNPLLVDIRIWEVQQESNLPDLSTAATQIGVTYNGFSAEPIPGFPEVVLVTFNLEDYDGGTVPLPVINPGKKYVVELMNQLDDPDLGNQGMKIAAEFDGQCPAFFWEDGTNIFFNYDHNSPGSSTWSFKEDIGNSTNFFIGVTYYDGWTARAPSMGLMGIFAVLGVLSLFMFKQRKR